MEPIDLARQLTKSLQIYHIMPLLSRMVYEYLVADKCILTHFHSSKEKRFLHRNLILLNVAFLISKRLFVIG